MIHDITIDSSSVCTVTPINRGGYHDDDEDDRVYKVTTAMIIIVGWLVGKTVPRIKMTNHSEPWKVVEMRFDDSAL